jgi:hypothetical protein
VLNHHPALAVRQKSEMPDLDEAAGQHVQQETADELDGIEGHFFALVMVFRVPPAETHATFL